MCPLRYIVLLVSAIVALGVMLWGSYDKEDEYAALHEQLKSSQDTDSKDKAAKTQVEEPTKPWDFLTGKYLYKQWNQWRARSVRVE